MRVIIFFSDFTSFSEFLILPEVKFVTAHAASFLARKSPFFKTSISGGKIPLPMMIWICSGGPAVMLEMVHAASLTTFIFSWIKRDPTAWIPPASMTASVCRSLPVTMLPTARRAGVITLRVAWVKSLTRRGTAPESTTYWMRSLLPSVKYDKAQHVSATKNKNTSKSQIRAKLEFWKFFVKLKWDLTKNFIVMMTQELDDRW